MTDLKLFSLHGDNAVELAGSTVTLEKSLQTLMERNLETLLGVRFLASEYSTGPKHGGRVDSLGIDENGSPVIIEYKRSTNQSVINQGLYYLDWLMDHCAEFELLVTRKLGADVAETIDWSAPRLLCIAGGFTKFDDNAIQQMGRNIELIRYKRFGEDILLLEQASVSSAPPDEGGSGPKSTPHKDIGETLEKLEGSIKDLHAAIDAHLLASGDDVRRKVLRTYVAYKRLNNFACLVPTRAALKLYLTMDPTSVALREGFSRDMSQVGHQGTGDLEVTIQSLSDFEEAKPLIDRSYESS